MCTNCDKCDQPLNLKIDVINDKIQLSFLNGAKIKSLSESMQIFEVKVTEDKAFDFVDSLVYKKSQQSVSSIENTKLRNRQPYILGTKVRENISNQQNDYFLKPDQINPHDRFYSVEIKKGHPIFEISNNQVQSLLFSGFDPSTNKPVSNQMKTINSQSQENQTDCIPRLVYILSLSPTHFEYIIDSSITKDTNFYFYVKNKCEVDWVGSLATKAKELSYSIGFLYLSQFLEFTFFQLLNSKDMLDIILLDEFDESDQFKFWVSKLTPLDCNTMKQVSTPKSSWDSNVSVKKVFLNDSGGKTNVIFW